MIQGFVYGVYSLWRHITVTRPAEAGSVLEIRPEFA